MEQKLSIDECANILRENSPHLYISLINLIISDTNINDILLWIKSHVDSEHPWSILCQKSIDYLVFLKKNNREKFFDEYTLALGIKKQHSEKEKQNIINMYEESLQNYIIKMQDKINKNEKIDPSDIIYFYNEFYRECPSWVFYLNDVYPNIIKYYADFI